MNHIYLLLYIYALSQFHGFMFLYIRKKERWVAWSHLGGWARADRTREFIRIYTPTTPVTTAMQEQSVELCTYKPEEAVQ